LRSDIAELDTAAVQQAIEDIQAVQSSRTVVERWNDVSTAYQVLHNVYQQAYTTLFAQRTDCYTQAQQKIAPFGPVPEEITSRIVAPHPDATMQQTLKLADLLMDIQLVEKRTDDIIVRLYSKQQEQQENQQQAVKEENKPLHVLVRTTEFLDGEFCDEQTFEAQIAAFAERVREELRHGRTVVVR
jgi:hypothetical protein